MCLRHSMDGEPLSTKTCLGFIVFAFLHAFEWIVHKYPTCVIYLSMGLEVILFIMATEANFFLYQDQFALYEGFIFCMCISHHIALITSFKGSISMISFISCMIYLGVRVKLFYGDQIKSNVICLITSCIFIYIKTQTQYEN